jgi:hypothetical protein
MKGINMKGMNRLALRGVAWVGKAALLMPIKDMILEMRGRVSPVPPEAVETALGSGDIAEHIQ